MKPVASNVSISVSFTCSKCGDQTSERIDLSTSGECIGHRSGEYCYCSYPEIRADVECPSCKAWLDVLLKEG